MAQAIAYPGVDGTCAAAMRFYAEVLGLGARLGTMIGGGASPVAEHILPEQADRILRARIALDDGSFLHAGDARPEMPYNGINGGAITMNHPEVAEAECVFDALATGGRVTMPFETSFDARKAGMAIDRFGTPGRSTAKSRCSRNGNATGQPTLSARRRA